MPRPRGRRRYAAGDITRFPVKQGGIATQQADVAAEAIAAAAGADVEPERFRPVLRGLLLAGVQPRYLRREMSSEPVRGPVASFKALWWPPAKIAGRYLSPFLAAVAGVDAPPELPGVAPGTVEVERELDSEMLAGLDSSRLRLPAESDQGARVGEAMSRTPLVVAPEDTLGELAERMLREDERAAAVSEYGRLIGVLTASDLLRASAARAHPADARARQWMTAEPVAVSADTPIRAAEFLMEQYGVHHLPVVEGERPIGMLDRHDVHHEVSVLAGLSSCRPLTSDHASCYSTCRDTGGSGLIVVSEPG